MTSPSDEYLERFERIVVTEDVQFADGTLKVEQGAVGAVVGSDQGYLDVVFFQGQTVFIRPGYHGRLFQRVPRISTRPI